jgi:nucleoside-diphosphate-sugar epimerase
VKGMSNRPAGVHARGGDTTKQKQLGFTASIDFRAGIQRALNWYLEKTSLKTKLKPSFVS